jgi:hypothetical protein
MSSPRPRLWQVVLCAGAVALLGAGCSGETGPKVYPVHGKVIFKGKGNMRQLLGGKVRLQSLADPSIAAVGEVEDDGVFSLGSFINEKALPGVPAGEYKARLELRVEDADTAPRSSIPAKYLDFNKSGLSLTVPTTGEFVIEVETGR